MPQKPPRDEEQDKQETEGLSDSAFRKSLKLFINGEDSEGIAEELDVPQASVEYELLPYISELKAAQRSQKRFEEEVKCRI